MGSVGVSRSGTIDSHDHKDNVMYARKRLHYYYTKTKLNYICRIEIASLGKQLNPLAELDQMDS